MPYENVWDCTNHSIEADGTPVEPTQRRLVVSWSHGPTPVADWEEPSGWVQVMSEDTGKPARFAAEDTETRTRLTELLESAKCHTGDDAVERLPHNWQAALVEHLLPYVRHAFGEPVGGFAVTLDRQGINRSIRLLQRARDVAHGRDA